MNSDLIAQMIRLRDLAAPLALGVPTMRSLVVCKRRLEPGTQRIAAAYLAIAPSPHIQQATPRTANAYRSMGIDIEMTDYEVSGLSRAYTREQLVGTDISYYVDGVLDEPGTTLISGQACDFVGLTFSTLCWNLVLRRRPDQR